MRRTTQRQLLTVISDLWGYQEFGQGAVGHDTTSLEELLLPEARRTQGGGESQRTRDLSQPCTEASPCLPHPHEPPEPAAGRAAHSCHKDSVAPGFTPHLFFYHSRLKGRESFTPSVPTGARAGWGTPPRALPPPPPASRTS